MEVLKNKNRGYQQLRVWQDAIEFYKLNSRVFGKLPYEFRRVASQAMASADSGHRNIAEGYCRRSIPRVSQFPQYSFRFIGRECIGTGGI